MSQIEVALILLIAVWWWGLKGLQSVSCFVREEVEVRSRTPHDNKVR
jgi:hypothetical protein